MFGFEYIQVLFPLFTLFLGVFESRFCRSDRLYLLLKVLASQLKKESRNRPKLF